MSSIEGQFKYVIICIVRQKCSYATYDKMLNYIWRSQNCLLELIPDCISFIVISVCPSFVSDVVTWHNDRGL